MPLFADVTSSAPMSPKSDMTVSTQVPQVIHPQASQIPAALQNQLSEMQRQMQQMSQQLAYYQQREQYQFQQQQQYNQYGYPQQYPQQYPYQYNQYPQIQQQPSAPVAASVAVADNKADNNGTSSPTPVSSLPPTTPSSPVPSAPTPVASTPNPSTSSSPVQFSSILRDENIHAPIPSRHSSFAHVVSGGGGGFITPSSPQTSPQASSITTASISKCIKSFKNFASPPNRLELWCKCDYCKFYAMNGVDVTTNTAIKDMKNLIVDKRIDFMAFPFRMACKCGAKSNAKCTHPQMPISMLFAHEEDPEYDEAWFAVDWEDRCSRAHCWDKNCKRQHHALTLRDKKIF